MVAHKYGKLVAYELAPTRTHTHAYTPVEGPSIFYLYIIAELKY